MTGVMAKWDGLHFRPLVITDEIAALPKLRRLMLRVFVPRAPAHHRLFFAVIRWAHDHWPATHDFQPTSPGHLRAWLTCKAGRRHVDWLPLSGVTPEAQEALERAVTEAVLAVIGRRKGYAFVAPWRGGLAVIQPHSIKWEAMDEVEFRTVSEPVFGLIEAVFDTTLDDIVAAIKVAAAARRATKRSGKQQPEEGNEDDDGDADRLDEVAEGPA